MFLPATHTFLPHTKDKPKLIRARKLPFRIVHMVRTYCSKPKHSGVPDSRVKQRTIAACC